ncbi:hypothetical protein EW093_11620 [Thiospirochaeta perfilievii]|uniref:Wadjet protein JetD C-terminal domain-containing protein n=1 Tax=Thiospirochaeta perfilievii TaxID=252967 RepID=A0A5C1QE93_9SPIO|nr:hypothetical protein EW093_11620 [Thiospirochaeta perfilievii]
MLIIPPRKSEETTFEKRYGLRLDQNFYVHIRFPDNSFYNGLKEVAIPLEEINKTNIHFKNIYIVENRMNYLTLLLNSGDIVIWGMGKGLSLFRDINFLQDVNIYYWGDI